MLKRIQQLEEGEVSGGKHWRQTQNTERFVVTNKKRTIDGKKVRVTRKEFQRWHLMKQRMRDARKGETKQGEDVVRKCKAMDEEESWSGWKQVKEQALEINHGNWKKWEVRDDPVNNETILGNCSFDFDEKGHGVALELEAVKRVTLEEEYRWNVEG